VLRIADEGVDSRVETGTPEEKSVGSEVLDLVSIVEDDFECKEAARWRGAPAPGAEREVREEQWWLDDHDRGVLGLRRLRVTKNFFELLATGDRCALARRSEVAAHASAYSGKSVSSAR